MMALVLVLCDEWLLVIGRYMVVSLWWELMPKKRSGTSCSHFARFISSMEWDVPWNGIWNLNSIFVVHLRLSHAGAHPGYSQGGRRANSLRNLFTMLQASLVILI